MAMDLKGKRFRDADLRYADLTGVVYDQLPSRVSTAAAVGTSWRDPRNRPVANRSAVARLGPGRAPGSSSSRTTPRAEPAQGAAMPTMGHAGVVDNMTFSDSVVIACSPEAWPKSPYTTSPWSGLPASIMTFR